jgi:hypothetical protein
MRARTSRLIVFGIAATWATVGEAQGLDDSSGWYAIREGAAARQLKATCAQASGRRGGAALNGSCHGHIAEVVNRGGSV